MKRESVTFIIAVIAGLLAISTNLTAQNVYGDLDLLILINNEIPAEGAIAFAIDPEWADTSTAIANVAGIAQFEDLYVYTINQISKLLKDENAGLSGLVKIYDINGRWVDAVCAKNGSVLWYGNNTSPPGVYIAIDDQGYAIKFIYTQQTICIGQVLKDAYVNQQKSLSGIAGSDTTKTYLLEADGRFLEYNPFNVTSTEIELFEGFNELEMNPNAVPDTPTTGELEVLVNGAACGDGSLIRLVRPGEIDTAYLLTQNGSAFFDELANITSHPFGNFSRAYLALISGADFLPETNTIQVNLGNNYFQFNPDPVPSATGAAIIWKGTTPTLNVEVNIWKLINPTDTATYITNAAGKIWYDLPAIGPTQYVFQSHKDDGVNPVLVSMDTATLVSGSNPLLNFYLEQIPQLFRIEGTIHHFYDQTQIPQSTGMMLRDKATQIVIDSAGINPETGLYSLANIPAGTQGELVMVSPSISEWFHRINDYNLPPIVQSFADTLIENQNSLLIPRQFVMPKTENDPGPETVAVEAEHVRQLANGSRNNGEDIARQEGRIYLTNFGTPSDSAYYFAAENAIDSLFFGGEGSHLVLVPNQINISRYHRFNYDINVGFPNELGYNVTRGGGNITTLIYSTQTTGSFILGGQINMTGDEVDILSAIKELHGRLFEFGNTSYPGIMNNSNPAYPTEQERACSQAIRNNHYALTMTGNDIFPLNNLTTSISTRNTFRAD